MSESLRKLVDIYIDRSDANTFLPNVDENEKAMYVDSTKTALYEQIVGEVKSEVMDEVTKEAELRIEKKAEIKRLDELKRLFKVFFRKLLEHRIDSKRNNRQVFYG